MSGTNTKCFKHWVGQKSNVWEALGWTITKWDKNQVDQTQSDKHQGGQTWSETDFNV